MKLSSLETGQSGVITKVGGDGALRQHFLDMGLIPGTKITLIKYAPMGDPVEFRVFGYELTLRLDDAKKISVKAVSSEEDFLTSSDGNNNIGDNKTDKKIDDGSDKKNIKKSSKKSSRKKSGSEHPGLGEGGRFHEKSDEKPLAEGSVLTFALIGNQNCGKTTLFNQLTGSNQHVGNFPGVTVDKKSGRILNMPYTEVTDLPGIYSMSPYSSEEIVTRQFVINEKPTGIINIVDATNIERNLYLTMQLMEMDIPVVLALNMMDEVRGNGGTIHINEMEELLGIPVVPISASRNEGVKELVEHAIHVAKYQEKPTRNDFCEEDENGGTVHRCIHGIMHLIEDHAKEAGIPVRFAATKLIEGDKRIRKLLKLSSNEKDMLGHIILQMEEERGLDASAAIADMRFSFINKLVESTVVKPAVSKEHIRSQKLDGVFTGKYTAIPAFIGIMGLIFWLTFNVIGPFFQDILGNLIDYLTENTDVLLSDMHVNETVHSLVIDGIFTGVGSVLSFMPIIVTLFFFLSLLEDTGYMARVAFVMDKMLRKIGLSGRSIVPMLIGFGCTVPGVMATRTLPSERDRKMTIMLTPFMSCSAKLPIYAYFTAAFFPDHGALVMIMLYVIGIIVGIVIAFILKNSVFRGEAVPFVMELPNYRLPGAKNVARLLWEKAEDFLKRAFTVIFIATIVIWFMQSFNMRFSLVEEAGDSILAVVAGVVAPVFAPLGFADWRVSTALISGFMAKESVVSTLTVLYSGAGGFANALEPEAALPLLIFCLLYTPCVAAVASVKRELGTKWALAIVLGQCGVAWICALLCRLICIAMI